jgi:hypothetical protein
MQLIEKNHLINETIVTLTNNNRNWDVDQSNTITMHD